MKKHSSVVWNYIFMSFLQNESMDAEDLFRKKLEKERMLQNVYKKQLSICLKKVEEADRIGYSECVFTAPEFMLDTPSYKLEKCMEYIYVKLIDRRFGVEKFKKNNLHVTWNLPRIRVRTKKKIEEEKEKKGRVVYQEEETIAYADTNTDSDSNSDSVAEQKKKKSEKKSETKTKKEMKVKIGKKPTKSKLELL